MAPRTRDRLVTAAKTIATIAIVALVLWRTPLGELAARLGRLSASDVLLLVVVMTVQVGLSVVRWWRLLRSVGERVPYVALFGDVCVGLLYNMVLPGGVGGDVVRALRARLRLQAPHHAWSTSLYERIIGLFAMTASGTLAMAFGLQGSVTLPPLLRLLTFALTFALALAFVFASLPFRILVRFLGHRLPAAASADLAGIGADLGGPLAKLHVRGEAFAWSLAYQATNLLFVMIGAAALGAPGHERAIVVGVPIIIVLSVAPITIGGFGLREGLYVGVLGALGLPRDVALGLAAFYLVSNLVFSLVGTGFMVVERARSAKARHPA